MRLLAVNFHYFTAKPAERGRAIFPTSAAAFRAQLDALGEHFAFVSRDRLVAACAGEAELPEQSCVITFDDGLTSQYEVALRVLEEAGVPGIFFVPGQPIAEARALLVHKIHHVREALDADEFLSMARGVSPDLPDSLDDLQEPAANTYRYDTPADATVKYLLNFFLPVEARERLIGAMFDQVHGDERAFCAELYMSAEQVRDLEQRGALGAHSFHHRPLGRLEPAELRDDLERNAAMLEEAAGVCPRAISYPYGSREAATPEVAAAARELGFRVGFTMERAFNRSLDDPLLLARVDTNDALGGRSPLFTVTDAGAIEVAEGMSDNRRWFAAAGSEH